MSSLDHGKDLLPLRLLQLSCSLNFSIRLIDQGIASLKLKPLKYCFSKLCSTPFDHFHLVLKVSINSSDQGKDAFELKKPHAHFSSNSLINSIDQGMPLLELKSTQSHSSTNSLINSVLQGRCGLLLKVLYDWDLGFDFHINRFL